jgi:hypothetical protein
MRLRDSAEPTGASKGLAAVGQPGPAGRIHGYL